MSKRILNCLLCTILTIVCCVPFFSVNVKAETATFTMDSAIFNNDNGNPSALKSFAFVIPDEWKIITATAGTTSSPEYYVVVCKPYGDAVSGGHSDQLPATPSTYDPEDTILKCDVTASGVLSTTVGSNMRIGYFNINGSSFCRKYIYYANRIYHFAYVPYNCGNLSYDGSSGATPVIDAAIRYLETGNPNDVTLSAQYQKWTYTGNAPLGGLLGIGSLNPRIWCTANAVLKTNEIVHNMNTLGRIDTVNADVTPKSPDREFVSSQNSNGDPVINVNNEFNFNIDVGGGGSGENSGNGSFSQTQTQTIEENAVNVTVNNNNNLNQESMQYLNQIINNGGSGQDSFQNAIGNITGFLDIATNLGGLIAKILGFLPSWVLNIFSLVFSLLGVMVVFRLVHLFI